MAILKESYRKVGTNAAAITKNSSWVGMLRVRMTDLEIEKYGTCNKFRFYNKSAQAIRIRFGLNNEGGEPYYDVPAASILNINVDDGTNVYGFDVLNLDASTDLAIGEFQFVMSRIEQIPEEALIKS